MGSRKNCSVIDCYCNKSRNPEKTFHRFPMNDDVRQKWLTVCDPKLKLLDNGRVLYASSYRVCSGHFQKSDFKDVGGCRKFLKKEAVPSKECTCHTEILAKKNQWGSNTSRQSHFLKENQSALKENQSALNESHGDLSPSSQEFINVIHSEDESTYQEVEETDPLMLYKSKLEKNLIAVFKCAVCSKPFSICTEGHLSCRTCEVDLLNCPVCRNDFTEESEITFKQMLKGLNIFSCKNKTLGCNFIGKYDFMEQHESSFCYFRNFCCFLNTEKKCKKMVSLYNFKDHINSDHVERQRVFNTDRLDGKLIFNKNKDFENIRAVEIVRGRDSFVFLENVIYNSATMFLSIAYYYLSTVESADEYKYIVFVKNSKNPMEMIGVEDSCLPVGLSDKNEFMKQNCTKFLIGHFQDSDSFGEVGKKNLTISVLFNFDKNEDEWERMRNAIFGG